MELLDKIDALVETGKLTRRQTLVCDYATVMLMLGNNDIAEDCLNKIHFRELYNKHFTWAEQCMQELNAKGRANWDADDWESYHYIEQIRFENGYYDE